MGADVETVYAAAMAAWRTGAIDDWAAIEQVTEAGEDDPRTQRALGYLHRERGGHAAADEAFTRALDGPAFAGDAALWAACGEARLACARFEGAAAAYARALALAPGDPVVAARLDDARHQRREVVATWLAGTIDAGVTAGARVDCVGVGARHAAVVRTAPGADDGWVTLHALSDAWDGGDELIHDQRGRWVAAAPGGARIAIGTADDTTVFSLASLTASELPAMSSAVWLDADRLIAAFDDGRFALMTGQGGHLLDEWRVPAPLNGVELLPGGRFAVCTGASSIELVDLRQRATVLRLPLAAPVPDVAISDDGARAALLTETSLAVWDVVGRRRIVTRRVPEPRRGLRFWPDGDHLLSGGSQVELWDVATGRRRHLAGLRGRLVVEGVYGFVISDGRPEATSRLITRIRLGTVPTDSPALTR